MSVNSREVAHMLQIMSTDLGNGTGDFLAAAAQEPVATARHGMPRFVLNATERFERLKESDDTRCQGLRGEREAGGAKLRMREEIRIAQGPPGAA
ncbi:MAG: hypothetical protein F4Y60_00535 [Boseongicola sp. SB0664_bin_43]|uniref:Type II toxin-antitoxin system Phd/YefM family antitoxin n=1 Tax=Boseongicola sp. SB0664_bin_43 TaxID=2604844 RepID=A0A6B0XXV0_9RHOB|nr:hypothetical protein [Boseongicola sp. SB0664_bin_43]MYK32264.1 hypothetical protein [Boseongicola sp. SB0670_bin_30]